MFETTVSNPACSFCCMEWSGVIIKLLILNHKMFFRCLWLKLHCKTRNLNPANSAVSVEKTSFWDVLLSEEWPSAAAQRDELPDVSYVDVLLVGTFSNTLSRLQNQIHPRFPSPFPQQKCDRKVPVVFFSERLKASCRFETRQYKEFLLFTRPHWGHLKSTLWSVLFGFSWSMWQSQTNCQHSDVPCCWRAFDLRALWIEKMLLLLVRHGRFVICPPVGLILSKQVATHRQQLAYPDIETQYTDFVHTANTWWRYRIWCIAVG